MAHFLQLSLISVYNNRHTIRRRRRVVADRIASLSGMSIQPLGYDDCGRSYWQFPNSLALFISPPCSLEDREPDRDALLNMLKSSGKTKKPRVSNGATVAAISSTSTESADSLAGNELEDGAPAARADNWIIVEDLDAVGSVIDLLGRSADEISLRKTLAGCYAEEIERVRREKAAAAATVKAAATDTSAAEGKVEDEKQGGEVGNVETDQDIGNDTNKQSGSDQNDEGSSMQQDESKDDSEQVERDFSGMEGRVSLPRKAAPVFAKPGEGKAVRMSIMPEKGVEVLPRYVIQQEKVFEDTELDDESDDEEDDERAYQEYFVFSRSSKSVTCRQYHM